MKVKALCSIVLLPHESDSSINDRYCRCNARFFGRHREQDWGEDSALKTSSSGPPRVRCCSSSGGYLSTRWSDAGRQTLQCGRGQAGETRRRVIHVHLQSRAGSMGRSGRDSGSLLCRIDHGILERDAAAEKVGQRRKDDPRDYPFGHEDGIPGFRAGRNPRPRIRADFYQPLSKNR